ncbi:MAG TPA: S9 family peptidase [Blastocatellia bacterium]|nr:S9 family peptidase [Blastocatellia bacterium]
MEKSMTIAQEQEPIRPPVAKKAAKTITIHGDTLIDDYHWLREKNNPEVLSYLEAENAYTDQVMKPTESFQAELYKELLGRIKESDATAPAKNGDYYYYSRTEQGKQYQILCRKRGRLDAKEEVYLDLNELAKGQKFLGLGPNSVSDDGNLLAYSIDTTGFRQYRLRVKDLRTGELLADTAERVTSLEWADDNKTLFYITEDDVTKRSDRLYKHRLGDKSDDLIYQEKDELFNIELSRSRSRKFIFVTSDSFTSSEVRYIPSDRPDTPAKVMLPREAKHRYYANHHGDLFYIRTDENAKNFRLVAAPVSDPQKKNWKEVIPHRKDVMLEDTDFFADFYVAYERENGLQKMRVTDFKTGQSHYIDFPEPVYSASPSANFEYNTTKLRFAYQSFITPSSVFDYDMRTRERTLLKQTEVLGGYNPSEYKSERIYATAADGTRIPVSLVYKKELARDGKRPALLQGYGAYGVSSNVGFSSNRLSLINRGVIFALAHIRGGGEMGEVWHDQGKMMMKRNSFSDFIAAAEHLIAQKYTSADRLVITGGSAGGLLMGAVINMRPELFKAAVVQVPFVDVINTMLDESLPLTVGEFQEWGNPKVKAEYDYMKSYSPYDNIAAKAYPTMLVRTSLNDSQVMYWEPAKYVAKLRAMKTDHNPLLFKIHLGGGGHGGVSGRYDALKDAAFDYAFILSQLGIMK